MEFNRIYLYGVDIEGQKSNKPPYTFFADVVFIDMTYEGRFPSVYQLKDLPAGHTPTVDNHGIAMVGELLSINRQKKRIFLVDGNMVCYNHLIIVNTGRHDLHTAAIQDEKEFAAGLQALLEALKLRDQLSFDWTVLHKYQSEQEKKTSLETNQVQQGKKGALHRMVGSCAKDHMVTQREEEFSSLSHRGPSEKRLYEIIL